MEILQANMMDVEVKLKKIKGDFNIIKKLLEYKSIYDSNMEASLSYICYLQSCLYEVCEVEIPDSNFYGDFDEEIFNSESYFYDFKDNGSFDGKDFIFLTRGDDIIRLNELKSIVKNSDNDILSYLNWLEINIKSALNKQ